MKKYYLQPAVDFCAIVEDVLTASRMDPVVEDGFTVQEQGKLF